MWPATQAQVSRGLLLSLLARGTTLRAQPSRPKNAAAPAREPSTLESPRLSRLLSEHRRASYQEPALSNMTGNMWSKELGCWRVSRARRPMVVEDCLVLEPRRCPGHQRWPTSHFKPPTTRQPDVRRLSFEENSKEIDYNNFLLLQFLF